MNIGEPIGLTLRNKNIGNRRYGNGGYWEQQIRDDNDFERHMAYIHFNPVRHGHCKHVSEWPYSTFHRYAEQGDYPLDWGGGNVDDNLVAGE